MGIENSGTPTNIISNEYLTLEKRKLSTSQNWAVWVPDILKNYHPDSIRYFLTVNAPENRDTDFSWREFIYSHNGELLGAFANFVNRNLKFIEKTYESKVPQVQVDVNIQTEISSLYQSVGQLIEAGHFKKAMETIFEAIRAANRYFDERKPWIMINDNKVHCEETLATCVYIIQNLGQLLQPFIPFACKEIGQMLNTSLNTWDVIEKLPLQITQIKPLYERIDVKQIELELEKLKANENSI